MDDGVADDAALADLAPRGLELGLDESDEAAIDLCEINGFVQDFGERYEAGVAGDDVHRLGSPLR